MEKDRSGSNRDFSSGREGRKRFPRLGGRTATRIVVALAVAAVPFAIAVPSAFAGVGLGITPSFPASATVGQTNVPGSITITNLSNGAEAGQSVTLSDITLVPSCGAFTSGSDCAVASADPGVFQVSATGVGAAGTACAGDTFTVTVSDAVTGQLLFTPNAAVVLSPVAGATPSCVINFTFNVVKVPVNDVSPAPGIQTEQIAAAIGTATDGLPGSGTGTSLVTVTAPGAPTCALTNVIAGPPVQIQVTVQDTVSGLAAGAIVTTEDVNATLSVPPTGPNTTTPVVITATKVNQSLSSEVGFSITDRSGNVTTCDPTAITVNRTTGESLNQSISKVSSTENLLTVANGTPGISTLVVTANSHVFVLRLTNGQTATLNLASALKAGNKNTVSFIAAGPANASAVAILHN